MELTAKDLSQDQLYLLRLMMEHVALKFSTKKSEQGLFKLKSGRMSPYFLNAGALDDGEVLAVLGRCYADIIVRSGLSFDVLFGPAYKGIPLVTAASTSLWDEYKQKFPIAYNRKEVKDHGEGGSLIGASLVSKRVLVLDDVITGGTAFRESVDIIQDNGGEVAGLVILLDRKEQGLDTEVSAVQQIQNEYDIPVSYVFNFFDLRTFIQKNKSLDQDLIVEMDAYYSQYGAWS